MKMKDMIPGVCCTKLAPMSNQNGGRTGNNKLTTNLVQQSAGVEGYCHLFVE